MALATMRTVGMRPIGLKCFETSLSKDRFVPFETTTSIHKVLFQKMPRQSQSFALMGFVAEFVRLTCLWILFRGTNDNVAAPLA